MLTKVSRSVKSVLGLKIILRVEADFEEELERAVYPTSWRLLTVLFNETNVT